MSAQFHYDFQFLGAGELFALIRKGRENRGREAVAQGKSALGEFRRRYERHVNRVVLSACSRLVCSVPLREVADGVFAMVWELADDSSLGPLGDKKAERHRVCLWLGSPICQNIIKKLNDKQLLARALRREEGEYEMAVSERALAEFVRRHAKRLRRRCTQFSWGVLSEMEVEELVQDTFIRAWQKAHTFKDFGISDQKSLRYVTAAWLNKTALRLFIDRLDSRTDVETVFVEDETKIDVITGRRPWREPSEGERDSARDELLEKMEELSEQLTKEAMLRRLTNVERVVLQFDQQDFPDKAEREEAFKALDARLDIKSGTRRQHLKRAKDKIRAHVEAGLEEFVRGLGLEVPHEDGGE